MWFKKYPYPPHRGSLEIQVGGGGAQLVMFKKKKYEDKLEFPEVCSEQHTTLSV